MRIAHLCLSSFYIDGYYYQENALPLQHKRDGHDVRIIASTETFSRERTVVYVKPGCYVNEHGISVQRLPYRKVLPHRIATKARMYPGVYRALAEYRPDVILFHGVCSWELLSASKYVKRHPGTKLYADCHGDVYNSARNRVSKVILHGGYYRWILLRALPQIQKILCISPESMEFASSCYRIPESRLEFYPLGGDVVSDTIYHEKRTRVRAQLGLRDDQVALVQAGKLDRRKKIVETLRVFGMQSWTRLRLFVVGSLQEDVRADVESLLASTPATTYVGWLDSAALLDCLCAADVYVQPGSQSAIMQNALCARCAVILDDVPSHKPFVDGNGWLVSGQRPLGDVLQEIDANPSRVERMSHRSLCIAKELLDYRSLAARIYR